MGEEFDFSKGQIPTNSFSKPGRGVVGFNIDRCITQTKMKSSPEALLGELQEKNNTIDRL